MIRDPLTGAYSRAMLDDRLRDEVDRSRRYGTSLCLIVFDVDHFKSVNDAFGHSRGDDVLREVSQRAQATIRGSDLLFRYGGDEFVLLLPNTQREPGALVAHRLTNAVASPAFPGEPPLSVTVSVGLAVFPDDGQTPHALFEAADHRSFQAKQRGRACVVADGPTTPSDHPIQESSRLIERDEALLSMQRFLDQLSSHRRGVLRIAGAPGTGRTRFLAEVMAAARLRNHFVLHLRGSRRAKMRPFGAWLEGSPSSLPLPEVGAETLGRCLETICATHQTSGLLIAADDLPDFDFLTFELLGQILSDPSLRCLGIAYTTDRKSARTYLEAPASLHDLVELMPLSREGTLVWLRTAMQWEPPSKFLDWLQQATLGTPGKLHEAILLLRERGLLRRATAREWAIDPKYTATSLSQKRVPTSLPPDRHLPAMFTDFVGREVEQQTVIALLDRHRVISLVGPGGIGKTRLSLQIGRARAGDFADGARFVALASISDPMRVVSAIATTLGVREIAGRNLRESLLASVSDKDMLLLLDNFEQVVAAGPLVAELCASAPLLRVLVTSREPLRIPGEHVFPVPPLPLPDTAAPGEDPTRFAAVALFVLRAQAAAYDFALTPENAPAIVELCARLDGLPLAIEIAAARVDRMTPEQMLAEQGRFFLNAEGARDLPSRQQTLRNVIDFSYALLETRQQRLFERLSVFARGGTAGAITAICDGGDMGGDLTPIVTSLVEKSLLHADATEDDTPRYLMLETIRAYASERLEGTPDGARFRRQHATYFGRVAEELSATLNGARQRLALEHMEREHPNFQAALTFYREWDPAAAIRLVLALAPFWERHGHWAEGRHWLDGLASLPGIAAGERARCLVWSGRLGRLQHEKASVFSHLRQAVDLANAVGDQGALGMALHELGCSAFRIDGDYDRGLGLLAQSITILRLLGDEPAVAEALANLGLVSYFQATYFQAEAFCNEALAIARKLGDARIAGTVTNVLGLVARARGEFTTAAALFEEHLSTCEWLDDQYGMMGALLSLAEFTRSLHDFDRASELYERHITLCREVGDFAGVARSVQDLGELARYRGRYDEATELYDRSLVLLEACGQIADILWVRRHQAEIAMCRGEHEKAKGLYRKSLVTYRERTHPLLVLLSLAGLATVAATQGNLDRAARLIGAAEPLFETSGSILAVDDRADFERRVASIKDRLDAGAFEAGRALGRAMSLSEAIALACEDGDRRDDAKASNPDHGLPA